MLSPTTVLDVGCGWGTFLHVFKQEGILDIQGIDGAWVKQEELFIDKKYFKPVDLEKPVRLGRQFDLVLCLEVAEHLKEEAADTLIETLTQHGKIIVFSAAIKGQRGQNHLNEQMHEYWQKKFLDKGFVYYDALRRYFWRNDQVDVWYKQNIFLVAHTSVHFSEEINATKVDYPVPTFIHPDLFFIYENGYTQLLEENRSLISILEENRKNKKPLNIFKRVLLKITG
jgi:2-polyprenyl-3-methyl-5-hydroxy-6-metoxy-1,4-benzoquinol methylase